MIGKKRGTVQGEEQIGNQRVRERIGIIGFKSESIKLPSEMTKMTQD